MLDDIELNYYLIEGRREIRPSRLPNVVGNLAYSC